MADNTVYPKIPESNWWAIRNQFKKSIPAIVTSSYLKSLLNLTTEKAARNLISPLRQMKLIDEDNKPTDRSNDWRNDEHYSSICLEITRELYPQELRALSPGPDYDREKIVGWFMHDAKIGNGAAKLCSRRVHLIKHLPRLDQSKIGPPIKQLKLQSSRIKNPKRSQLLNQTRIEPSD